MSRTPAFTRPSTEYAISGLPRTATNGLGILSVIGRSRVPMPAAKITAFTIRPHCVDIQVLQRAQQAPAAPPNLHIQTRLSSAGVLPDEQSLRQDMRNT